MIGCTCENNGDLCPFHEGIEEGLAVKQDVIKLSKMVLASAKFTLMLCCLPDEDGVNRIDEARELAQSILTQCE
jgi:hypothetical protein